MTDNSLVLLVHARQETRYIHQRQQRYIKRVAETDKTGGLYGCVDIQRTGQCGGLIRHDTDRLSIQTDITDNDVLGIFLLYLEEVLIISHGKDQLLHVVRLVGIGRNQQIQLRIDTVRAIGGRNEWRLFHIVIRQERHQLTYLQDTIHIVIRRAMSHSGTGAMHFRASQILHRNLFLRHAFHDLRAGDKHVARLFYHKDKVRQRRRVNRSTRARAHNGANLRDHAGGQRVPEEYLGISRQGTNPFLNTCAPRIVQPDHRSA